MADAIGSSIDMATYAAMLEAVGGDADFMVELVAAYAADAPMQISAMREAAARADAEALVRPAHTLKSSSASLGALALADVCGRLEAAARRAEIDGAIASVESIDQGLSAAITELNRLVAEA
jgi:HPt (histidine-containing phosphotransfer) domain-containing protein